MTMVPGDPDPADMAEIRDGARLAGFLPYLQRELDSMEGVLVSRVIQQIDAKTLTPEAALAAWMEMMAYRRLSRRLHQKIATGIGKGTAVGPRIGIEPL